MILLLTCTPFPAPPSSSHASSPAVPSLSTTLARSPVPTLCSNSPGASARAAARPGAEMASTSRRGCGRGLEERKGRRGAEGGSGENRREPEGE